MSDAPREVASLRRVRKRAVLRFVLVLVVLTALFNALFYIWVAESPYFQTYLTWNARACAFLLRWLGEGATYRGTLLTSPRFSLEIKHGCDALQPTAFFVFLVLASPVGIRLRTRIVPIVLGTLFLVFLNFVRIVTLYYAGIYSSPQAFETLHIDVWQAAFVFVPLLIWVAWAQRAARAAPTTDHDSA